MYKLMKYNKNSTKLMENYKSYMKNFNKLKLMK